MEPDRPLDVFRLREIEQQLAAKLQVAREQVRAARTDEQRQTARETFERALRCWTDFVAKRIVPEEFLRD